MQTDTTTLRELTVRYSVRKDSENRPVVIGRELSRPWAAASAFMALLQDEPAEVFAILCLTTKHRVIGYHEVSRGTLDSTVVHPRLCWAEHKRGYVAAVVMWGSRLKGQLHGPRPQHNLARLPARCIRVAAAVVGGR